MTEYLDDINKVLSSLVAARTGINTCNVLR